MRLRPTVVREGDREWTERTDPALKARSPIRWKLLIGGEGTPSAGLTVGVLEIPPGAAMLLHHHAPQEIYYVVEGEGRTEIDGMTAPVGPGTALFIPPNARHRTVNTGAGPLRFVWVFPTDTFREIEYHYDE
ncbi:MAG: cupin domain-containing protein [Candidatus Rokuibacteriota bacterium]